MLIVVQTLSSQSVITTTDVSSVGIQLSQSNYDSMRPAPTLQLIFSFIDVILMTLHMLEVMVIPGSEW